MIELDTVYKWVTSCIIIYFCYFCITFFFCINIYHKGTYCYVKKYAYFSVSKGIAFKILFIAIFRSLWYFHWIDNTHCISGELCEEKLDFCAQNLNPCQHDSKCILTPKGYKWVWNVIRVWLDRSLHFSILLSFLSFCLSGSQFYSQSTNSDYY